MTALRFHLHLEEGEGRLELARPLLVGPLSLEALTLSVGAVSGPVDLAGGASGLRHRRSHVLEARVDVPVALLREDLRVPPDSIGPEGQDLRVGPSEALARRLGSLGHVRVARDASGLRIVRPLRALLVEALVPHGWRAPDDGGTVLSVQVAGGMLRLEAEQRT